MMQSAAVIRVHEASSNIEAFAYLFNIFDIYAAERWCILLWLLAAIITLRARRKGWTNIDTRCFVITILQL